MPRYAVKHAYEAYRDGVRLGPWESGSEIELDADVAEFVERDSPGALVAVREKPEPKTTRQPKGKV